MQLRSSDEWRQPPPRAEEAGVLAGIRKLLAPIGIGVLVILKFAAKLKFIILPVLKFIPIILKTGGTMLLSIGIYAMQWGWWFAVGFVLLMLVHECGHLVAARRVGLKVSAPMFIPFMGAFIALKDMPPNAWIEAQVGYGGPLLGTLGALACEGLYWATGHPLLRGLAFSGLFLNLFNLAPVGFLDGGRIVTALSPWLWIVGFVLLGAMAFVHPNLILLLILVMSLPRIFTLFRRRSAAEARYYEVTPAQRAIMAVLYFGLVAALVFGMALLQVAPAQQ